MAEGTFKLVRFDESGVAGNSEHRRLVCVTDENEKLVIWGKEPNEMAKINSVLSAGLQCNISCEYRDPNEVHRQQYGHDYWVREDHKLEVLS